LLFLRTAVRRSFPSDPVQISSYAAADEETSTTTLLQVSGHFSQPYFMISRHLRPNFPIFSGGSRPDGHFLP
jgi:hypothetical protein